MGPENHYKIIPVGHNLFISHRDACGTVFPLSETLHIWRDDMPDNSCHMILDSKSSYGLVVEYKDGESLLKANVLIGHMAKFLAGSEPRLIHCTVGQTRAPTIAVLGKIVRGASLETAVGDIMAANWRIRGIVSNLCLTPLNDIFTWGESRNFIHCNLDYAKMIG